MKYSDRKREKLVQIACTPKEDFIVGTVIAQNDEWFAVETYTEFGRRDGLQLMRRSGRPDIRQDGQYLDSVWKQYEYRLTHGAEPEEDIQVDSADPAGSVLAYAAEHGRVIALELCGSGFMDVFGIVDSFDPDGILLRVADEEYGADDGMTVIDPDAVSRIWIDADACVRLEILRQKDS